MPEIKLTPATAARYHVVDYEKYLPYAPGMALIKAPGHTPGSQMIYVVLESGSEYLLAGDAAWHMDGIRLRKGKDAPWVTEDRDAVMAQLNWLHELDSTEKNLAIVVSHDDQQHQQLVDRGLLGTRLE
jgi:glyoxylase-like metal-dependent hydrolase (beta-lactamase superfamily II)